MLVLNDALVMIFINTTFLDFSSRALLPSLDVSVNPPKGPINLLCLQYEIYILHLFSIKYNELF